MSHERWTFLRRSCAEGIPFEVADKVPGRANLWARLKGGSEPALILLNHTDVVPFDKEAWSVGPLSGEMRDGHVYGRGAIDMKSTAILQLSAFLALHRAGKPLNRDVIFMATADEEAGGACGTGWLLEQRPELFQNAGFLLTEGGGGYVVQGKLILEVELTQKVPLWIRLVATGKPGHGSAPRSESAVGHLIQALARVQSHSFPARITPKVDQYFKAMAPHAPEAWRVPFSRMGRAVRDLGFLTQLQRDDHYLHALTRNTIAVTRLEASDKINVIPAKAIAELDCRLLPDEDAAAFLNKLRGIMDDPAIAIEVIMQGEPAASPADTPLYRVIEDVMCRHFPEAPVVPAVDIGFTDGRFFRRRGIVCYGFTPIITPLEDLDGIHGNDERISVENIQRGVLLMRQILEEFVY